MPTRDEAVHAAAVNRLAEDLHRAGDHAEAAIQYSLAYDLWLQAGQPRDAAVAMLNTGTELCELSKYLGAANCLEVAASISSAIGDHALRSRCLDGLGLCRSRL